MLNMLNFVAMEKAAKGHSPHLTQHQHTLIAARMESGSADALKRALRVDAYKRSVTAELSVRELEGELKRRAITHDKAPVKSKGPKRKRKKGGKKSKETKEQREALEAAKAAWEAAFEAHRAHLIRLLQGHDTTTELAFDVWVERGSWDTLRATKHHNDSFSFFLGQFRLQ